MTSLSSARTTFRLGTAAGLWALALTQSLAPMSATAADPHLVVAAAAGQLYGLTNILSVSLTFTPEQWAAMEPKGGPPSFGPPSRLPPDGGRPGAEPPPGGPPPGEPRPQFFHFGPSMALAPAFLSAGDADRNGRLSEAEFSKLAETWFAAWTKSNGDALTEDQIRDGLNASAPPPDFGGPGRGGPGRPGGGFSLQGPEGKRNGLASALGIEFPEARADLVLDDVPFKDVGIRYKGNGTFLASRESLKRSLKIDLAAHVKNRTLGGCTRLNLHNCVTDASWMNEVLSYRVFREAGVPAPRTAFARLRVTVPGVHDATFFGLYSLVENVDASFLETRFGTRKGALFKPVTPDVFNDLGNDWAHYRQTYDPKTDLTADDKARVMEFARLVTKADEATFRAGVGDYLDLDEFARFMAVTVWLSTLDSILGPGQNYYVYLHPKTRKFLFIPWDLDHSFGQFNMIGTQEQRERLSIDRPWQGEKRFLERVFRVPAFQEHYRSALDQLTRTTCKPAIVQGWVDELAAAIRPSVADESAEKLARFDKVVAGETVPPPGFGGGPGPAERPGGGPGPGSGNPSPRFGPPGGFMQPAKPIKTFATARDRSVREQLQGTSKGEVLNGFGPPGEGPGGRNFGPGTFLAGSFLAALDANHDRSVSRAEFLAGFAKWYRAWTPASETEMTQEALRTGIDRDLAPPPGAPPAMPGPSVPAGGQPPGLPSHP